MNIFEKATKKGLRFSTSSGNLNTEDLWVIGLEFVDQMYTDYMKELDSSTGVSLLKAKKGNDALQLRCDICRAVIESRLADANKADKAAETKAKNQLIMQIIQNKQNDELNDKSIEELMAMMDSEAA